MTGGKNDVVPAYDLCKTRLATFLAMNVAAAAPLFSQTTARVSPEVPTAFATALSDINRNSTLGIPYHSYAFLGKQLAGELRREDVQFLLKNVTENSAQLSIFTLAQMARDPQISDLVGQLLYREDQVKWYSKLAIAFAAPEVSRHIFRQYISDRNLSIADVRFAADILSIVGERSDIELISSWREKWPSAVVYGRVTWPQFVDEKVKTLETILNTPAEDRESLRHQELAFWRARSDRRGMHVPEMDYPIAAAVLTQYKERFSVEFLLTKLPTRPGDGEIHVESRLLDPVLLAIAILGEQRELGARDRLTELRSDGRLTSYIDDALLRISAKEL